MARLTIGEGKDWSFLNGVWADGPQGELIPPGDGGFEYIAVPHRREYSDLRAKFRFKFRFHHSGVRFLFRVQNSMQYYALDIPWCGQQNRNRHFWAGIVVADGTPLQRYLHLGLVTGICPESDRWYEGRLECSGPRIQAWIDGRPAADVVDHTFSAGRVGLMGIATDSRGTSHLPHFADLEVEGTEVGPSRWEELTPRPQHWITPCREVDPEGFQGGGNIVQSKSGALNVTIPFGRPDPGVTRRTVVVRSTDGGRTWSDPQPCNLPQGFGANFIRRDGAWVGIHVREGAQRGEEAFYTIESKDEGKTWSEPKTLNVRGEWPEEFSLPAYPSGQILRLRDGTVILPVYCRVVAANDLTGVVVNVSTNFVFRSGDDGETWSAPVRCDSNNSLSPGSPWFCPADFSEIGLAEVRDNVLLGYGRPGPWPYMWQVQSNDGGKTWEPAAFGAFPGYCPNLTRTASGALVAVHRYPYFTANVSYDGGLTWDAGTIIDYPTCGSQMLEVEPDVLLLLYGGHIVEPGRTDTCVLRLRVTRGGLTVAE